MCGIVGSVSYAVSRAEREDLAGRALERLAHRGPDDRGLWSDADGPVTLAHARLSILDLSPAGRNPMSWGDGRYWITFNGEVYNFADLRRELEAAGCRFRSRTDTEVVLAAYERWGPACVERFAGMFALALWDSERRTLFLARDRFGKKPLYYARYGGLFVFASELKAILADPRFPREVDPEALALYLRFGYVPSPRTVFRHAAKLPPAHRALLEGEDLRVERYWDPTALALSGASDRDPATILEDLEEALRVAVRQRTFADVPVGAFLSGGIDSSLVTALMREQAAGDVETFSIRFEDPEFDEADHARAVARHLGTRHREETCTESEMLAAVERLPRIYDEPFADSSAVPTLVVSRVARERVTVALSGDGGDELFFGYPRYHALSRAGWLLRSPAGVRRTLALAAGLAPGRKARRVAEVLRDVAEDVYLRFVATWGSGEIEAMTGRPAPEGGAYDEVRRRLAGLPAEERAPLVDVATYLPEDILTKVDRASMAVGLEVRSPLLDHRVAELALALPLREKWQGGEGKLALRALAYRRIPKPLLDRPKMGFGVPLAAWFRGPLRREMEDAVLSGELAALGLDPGRLRAVWGDFARGSDGMAPRLWNAFMLVRWSREWRVPGPEEAG